MQHKLVILGSMDEFIALVKQAKACGIYTLVCDGYPDGPAKAFADKSYDIDIRDVDGVAAMEPRSRKAQGEPRPVRMIPYGCARLRMTEMPTVE